MVNSWSRSWQLSTPTVTESHRMSLRHRTVGRKYQSLTLVRIKLFTTGAIGTMVKFCIQSWKICYIARHHLQLQSIASVLRKQFISGLFDRTVIDITQLGCPQPTNISLPPLAARFHVTKSRNMFLNLEQPVH